MAETTSPLLTYICSISARELDSDGNAKTFSIHVGNTGGFSSNVLKLDNMPISKIAGKYMMTFDPIDKKLIIQKPK